MKYFFCACCKKLKMLDGINKLNQFIVDQNKKS